MSLKKGRAQASKHGHSNSLPDRQQAHGPSILTSTQSEVVPLFITSHGVIASARPPVPVPRLMACRPWSDDFKSLATAATCGYQGRGSTKTFYDQLVVPTTESPNLLNITQMYAYIICLAKKVIG